MIGFGVRWAVAVLAVLVSTAGCRSTAGSHDVDVAPVGSSDGAGVPASTAATTVAPSIATPSVVTGSTVTGSTVTGSTVPGSTVTGSTVTGSTVAEPVVPTAGTVDTAADVACPSTWDTVPVVTPGWPGGLTSTGFPRLTDADVGAHSGFDRFVLDFAGADELAHSVRWIPGGPTSDGSGEPVTMAGAVFLEVRVVGAAYWTLEPSDWYAGPDDLDAAMRGTANLRQATMTGDFEGYVTWHLGAEQVAPFRVFTLESPARLVVDVCSAPGTVSSQAGVLGCVGVTAGVAETWVTGRSVSVELDGRPGDEVVTAFADPAAGRWLLRVAAADGSWSTIAVLEGSSLVFAAVPLGGRDIDLDGSHELFVRVDGGAYSEIIGVHVLDGCALVPTRTVDGQVVTWPIGASVMNTAAVECLGTGVVVWSASVTTSDTWRVEGRRLELTGSIWEPVPASAGLGFETGDLTPPFAADLMCDLES